MATTRKCHRCNTEMVSTCKNKKGERVKLSIHAVGTDGSGELYVSTNDGFFRDTFSGNVKVAVCPNCGEISTYVSPDDLQDVLD
jgi:hypothetical protein